MEMKPKEEVEPLKTQNFVMTLESTDYTHVGGFGKLTKIRNEPLCMFDLDTLIEQLQNARELIHPRWKEGEEDPEVWDQFRVFIWKHQPMLIFKEDRSRPECYTIAPVIHSNDKKFADFHGKEEELNLCDNCNFICPKIKPPNVRFGTGNNLENIIECPKHIEEK